MAEAIIVGSKDCPVLRVLAAIKSTNSFFSTFREHYQAIASMLGVSLEGGEIGRVWQHFQKRRIGLPCALSSLIGEWAIRRCRSGGGGAKLAEFINILDHLALGEAIAALEKEFKDELGQRQHDPANQHQPPKPRKPIGYGNTELHQAVLSHQVDEVKRLLNSGAVVNARNKHKLTPLLCASAGCFTEKRWAMISLLIENGADPSAVDETKETFLHKLEFSTPDQFHEVAVYLIGRHCSNLLNIPGGPGNFTAFHAVCSRSQMELPEETLSLLHENGVKFDCADNAGNGILKDAVFNCWDDTLVDTLIRFGAKYRRYNSKGENLIHVAAVAGNITALEGFIGRGLNVNYSDNIGNTPLHAVMGMEKPEDEVLEMVKLLLKKGSFFTRNDKGLTPRDLAKQKGLLDVVTHLDFKAVD